MAYYRYGNHKSVDTNGAEFQKTMVKDSKKGNTLLLDQDLIPFIPHLHLTPQGIVNVDNKYKSNRPVFDSLFHPEEYCEAINDWINPELKGDISFGDLICTYLRVSYNLRITHIDRPIFQMDDNITNAFRLIKYNPAMVSMHRFWGLGLLGFCTGQAFGDNASPANFNIAVVVWREHAQYLWTNDFE